MPAFDGTGPRGQGMFTGCGQGYCVLRLPDPGSSEPAVGYAGIQGTPVPMEAHPVLAAAPMASVFPTPVAVYGSRGLWLNRYAGCGWRWRRRR